MDNLVLFICGLAVTLMSVMGILVYMVSVGYEGQNKKPIEVDADLRATPAPVPEVKTAPEPVSIVGIPSVS